MGQSLVKNLLHLVYSTKHRQPLILDETRPGLFSYQAGVFASLESPAIVIGGTEDHVHALFSLSKNFALKDIVEEVKKSSSKWMKKEGSGNSDFYWQNENDVLERFTFQDNISRQIGVDLSTGIEYRPFLNDNVILLSGISALVPGAGFKDLYNDFDEQVDTMVAGFVELILMY